MKEINETINHTQLFFYIDGDLTSTGFIPSYSIKLTVDIIFQLDSFIRIASFIIHSIYFYLIYKLKIMRTKPSLYTHHANLIGFLFNLHYIIYWSKIHPKTSNPAIDHILCSISEQIWSILKTLRTYSIALIALYRLIAVFKIKLYNKINKSYCTLMIPLFLMYCCVLIISLANKFIFETTYGYLYCFDGYSKIFFNSFMYFIVQTVFGIIFPTFFGVVVYFKIQTELDLKLKVQQSSN
jgi:hypothetical protein